MNKKKCGVIGNPIAHSQSPEIHQQFASTCGINLQYDKFLVTEDNLSEFISNFFKNDETELNGTGLNVTLPFKQSVIPLLDQLSDNAKICQSVNTLFLNPKNQLCGDTTDGDGLLMDLDNLKFKTKNKNILVIGAGGASVSVICALLKNKANLSLINRSKDRISKLSKQFSNLGSIQSFDEKESIQFDGVICAISQANTEIYESTLPFLSEDAFIYDLNYGERAEETLNYFKNKGFHRLSDGYGMLVGQAAKSFEIWHGVMPKI